MDNIRFALLCALGVLGFMLYQAWQTDYPTLPTPTHQAQTTTSGSASGTGSAAAASSAQQGSAATGDVTATLSGVSNQDSKALAHGKTIHVITDEMKVAIDTHGGGLRRISLNNVPISAQKPHSSLNLINDTLPNFFIVQSGLAGKSAPSHESTFQAKKLTYQMAQGQKVLRVPLTWTDGNGHKVTKVYVFHRGSYRIGLIHKVDNETGTPWKVSQYVRFWRTPYQNAASIPFYSPFLGVGWYEATSGKKGDYRYETRAHDDLSDDALKKTQQGGWVAMVQHYFVGAAIPPHNTEVKLLARPKNVPGGGSNGFTAGFITAPKTVAPGQHTKLHTTLFIGPKIQNQLAATAPGLDLTINYGWLTILAKPCFWVLAKIHTVFGNWGVSIILLTILIKLIFYKLSERQYRSMARMRKFAPRMKQLKEKYGDDKQQLQSKMMELYKKEGVNPLGGCWPMLIQMPVFIALYYTLRGAVELRLAPFLWLNDLASPDPYYILPVIYGIGMFLQQRMQSTTMTMDPMQQKMMQIMPLGMAVFFAFFPSGLVLYYCVNTLLSITQQWYIYRKLDAEGLGHSAAETSSTRPTGGGISAANLTRKVRGKVCPRNSRGR